MNCQASSAKLGTHIVNPDTSFQFVFSFTLISKTSILKVVKGTTLPYIYTKTQSKTHKTILATFPSKDGNIDFHQLAGFTPNNYAVFIARLRLFSFGAPLDLRRPDQVAVVVLRPRLRRGGEPDMDRRGSGVGGLACSSLPVRISKRVDMSTQSRLR